MRLVTRSIITGLLVFSGGVARGQTVMPKESEYLIAVAKQVCGNRVPSSAVWSASKTRITPVDTKIPPSAEFWIAQAVTSQSGKQTISTVVFPADGSRPQECRQVPGHLYKIDKLSTDTLR